MLKTVIIEDDRFQMEILCDLLEGFPSVKVISKAFNAADGVSQVISGKPDLVFLDIDLPDKTGFELLKELPDHFFDFIFVTAHEKFALHAYKYDAISFLLKPLTKDAMQQALDKLSRKRKNQYSVHQVKAIIEDLRGHYGTSQKIAVPTVKEINYIKVAEIVRMEADGNYTTIFMTHGMPMLASSRIGVYEKQLSADKFFRIHDKHLINLRFVKKLTKGEAGTVIMEDDSQLPVSRRRKDEFLKVLDTIFS
jgi:two-component system, LytTR family, response regulator